MRIVWTPEGWEDCLSWQQSDSSKIKKINNLIKDIQKTPFARIGKPEALRFDLAGYWSRRIDLEHRLIYRVEDDDIQIISCKYHY